MPDTMTRDVYLFRGRNSTSGMEDVAFSTEVDCLYDTLDVRVRLRGLGFQDIESRKVMRNTYRLARGERVELVRQEPVFRKSRVY